MANSDARAHWLKDVVDAIKADGPEAMAPKNPLPTRPEARRRPAHDGELPVLVAFRLYQRVDLLDILDEARKTRHAAVLGVLDLYRKKIVPALLAQADDFGLKDVIEQTFFLTYHGVPDIIAWEAISNPAPSSTDVRVTSAWPPLEPVFWLTRQERDSWDQYTSLPESVVNTPDIQPNSYLYLDGLRYRAAASDSNVVGNTTLFAYGEKFMVLRKQR
ncbi:hypothetical protein [Streptacidiphilus carbonis]|uniref:hypothetical protein n=1 Tax=Streptacidiphilus carbonis TaxID=105422 RepID=UPI0005AA9B69|nr:hypothetical protein [Streptacidiphilus carbonis]